MIFNDTSLQLSVKIGADRYNFASMSVKTGPSSSQLTTLFLPLVYCDSMQLSGPAAMASMRDAHVSRTTPIGSVILVTTYGYI